ncbi:hypothetical protein ACFVT8_12200 [Lysinibacillus sp. NPDC058147]|uniref:hypothetical protein n=1 Tax=unclassified Lysinibacillus TaxID=2636778 RepID=UPI0036DBC913
MEPSEYLRVERKPAEAEQLSAKQENTREAGEYPWKPSKYPRKQSEHPWAEQNTHEREAVPFQDALHFI